MDTNICELSTDRRKLAKKMILDAGYTVDSFYKTRYEMSNENILEKCTF